jgi:hypothetical protein
MQSFGEVGEETLAALLYTEQASELLQFLDRTTACVAQKIVQRAPIKQFQKECQLAGENEA